MISFSLQREAQALFASIRDTTNRAAVTTTVRHVVAFVLALSFPPARSIARADVAASCLYVGPWPPLRPGASRGRLGRGIVVVPRLLLRLASRVIEAYVAVSCLESGLTRRSTRTRRRRGFTRRRACVHPRAVARLAGAPVNPALGPDILEETGIN